MGYFDYHCDDATRPTTNYIELAHQYGFDLFVISGYPLLEKAGLLGDGYGPTAIQIECIDEVAKLAGTAKWLLRLQKAQCAVNLISNRVYVANVSAL